jgi:topoisomerase-4 subunit B
MASGYTEASIKTLSSTEHIRMRPGMYIGRLGNGAHAEDGIYVLLKETIDNSVDEFTMGAGRRIDIELEERRAKVRDYGRGIPLGKLLECVSVINTGAKYDSEAFKKAVGLNGVGQKAVNALSLEYRAQAFREGQMKVVEFAKGKLKKDYRVAKTDGAQRHLDRVHAGRRALRRKPSSSATEFIEDMLWNYAFLNRGLTLNLNGKPFKSENGLKDLLLEKNLIGEPLYPIIHLEGDDIEIAVTHGSHYGEEYFSFVNGQHTTMGGTHLQAFREAFVDTIRNFYKKRPRRGRHPPVDRRGGLGAGHRAGLRVADEDEARLEPTWAGRPHDPEFVGKFVQQTLDVYLHRNPETADALLRKIEDSEHERKELAGIRTWPASGPRRPRSTTASCATAACTSATRTERSEDSTLFIVEGDSAAGSLTACRDVQTQAVFALKGKPLNTYGLSKKVIYENEEFHLLQSALNIEEGLDGLRYNRIVIATDADVDGMHIRLLLISFFLQFFPELIANGHLFILETPLFRVRNKKETHYCYSEAEKQAAVQARGSRGDHALQGPGRDLAPASSRISSATTSGWSR